MTTLRAAIYPDQLVSAEVNVMGFLDRASEPFWRVRSRLLLSLWHASTDPESVRGLPKAQKLVLFTFA
jgi:hypothetical protein